LSREKEHEDFKWLYPELLEGREKKATKKISAIPGEEALC
jgi:hypothetical protein